MSFRFPPAFRRFHCRWICLQSSNETFAIEDELEMNFHYSISTVRSLMFVTCFIAAASLLPVSAQLPVDSSGKPIVFTTPEPYTPGEHNNRGVELGTKGLWADAI